MKGEKENDIVGVISFASNRVATVPIMNTTHCLRHEKDHDDVASRHDDKVNPPTTGY